MGFNHSESHYTHFIQWKTSRPIRQQFFSGVVTHSKMDARLNIEISQPWIKFGRIQSEK